MGPKSILGTLGVTMGPYPKHAMSSDRVESIKSFMSFLSLSKFPYLKCDHYSQADRVRMVHYVAEHTGFHPRWFQSSHSQIKLQTFILLCEGPTSEPTLLKTVSKDADLDKS